MRFPADLKMTVAQVSKKISSFAPMKVRLLIILSFLFVALRVGAEQSADTAARPVPVISLITAEPGPEVFELYGHQGVRVKLPQYGVDLTYNFGVFDYASPNFVYRFVKGETDYYAMPFPTFDFLRSYEERGSRVVEQVLDLKPDEAREMALLLDETTMRENCMYRYKYCTNNCATRVLDILEASLSSAPTYADASPELTTYRQVMRRYDSKYPWYVLGVDVALGGDMDTVIGVREKMFVPMELMHSVADARLADGRQLVKQTNILIEGRGDVTRDATPWMLTPLFWAGIVLLSSVWFCIRAFRRGINRMRWLPTMWWMLVGVAGMISWFLIFVSEHEGTSPNLLGMWLNPLWLILAVIALIKRCDKITCYALILASAAAAAMIVVWILLPHAINLPLLLSCIATIMFAVGFIVGTRAVSLKKLAKK